MATFGSSVTSSVMSTQLGNVGSGVTQELMTIQLATYGSPVDGDIMDTVLDAGSSVTYETMLVGAPVRPGARRSQNPFRVRRFTHVGRISDQPLL